MSEAQSKPLDDGKLTEANSLSEELVMSEEEEEDTTGSDELMSGEDDDEEEDAFFEDDDGTCTCGKCIGGWLSPRNAYEVKAGAEIGYDSVMVALDNYYAGWRAGTTRTDLDDFEPTLDNIPEGLRKEGVDKKFVLGFAQLLKLIPHVIAKDVSPTRFVMYDVVRSLSGAAAHTPVGPISDPDINPAYIEYYLNTADAWLEKKYGSYLAKMSDALDDGLDWALKTVVEQAESYRDSRMSMLFGRKVVGTGDPEIDKLPKCKNDKDDWEGIMWFLTDC